MFWISITTSTSSLLQSILVKVSVLWYYTNPNGIFRSLFPKFCILRFCDLFQSPSNYLVDEIPLESSASATKKEGSQRRKVMIVQDEGKREQEISSGHHPAEILITFPVKYTKQDNVTSYLIYAMYTLTLNHCNAVPIQIYYTW